MLAYYRSACVMHVSGRFTVKIIGRPYTASVSRSHERTSKSSTRIRESTDEPEIGAKQRDLSRVGRPKDTIRRSTASFTTPEAISWAAAFTQAGVAKAKVKTKARSIVSSSSPNASNSNRAHQSNMSNDRKIWPGAPKDTVSVRTMLPSTSPKLISTERRDVPNTFATVTKDNKKKNKKNKANNQRTMGKWHLVAKDDVPTNPSRPSLPPPSSKLPTKDIAAISESQPSPPTKPHVAAHFSPIWPPLPLPLATTSIQSSPSLSKSSPSSNEITTDSSASSSPPLSTASKSTEVVISFPMSSSASVMNKASFSHLSSPSSPATQTPKPESPLTKAEEYERLWEAESKIQRSFAFRNPSSIPRSTLKTTPPPTPLSAALTFPPLSEVLSPPLPAHNIFPQLVPSAPRESPFQTPPVPSVLAKEIPSVELLDILVPPSDNSKSPQSSYTRSNLPQIPRRLPTAFRHPAFKSFLSEYTHSTPITSSSSSLNEIPSAIALEKEKEDKEDSVRISKGESTNKRTVVPFNVSDPNWSPSVTQVALLRAAAFKKDTFNAVRKPVLSTEGGPISRSKRRARYTAKREDERMKKEIQAKVERERLTREERGLGWSERIRKRLEERQRRDVETNLVLSPLSSSFSPPPFQPPPPPQPVPSSVSSASSSSLSSSSSSSSD